MVSLMNALGKLIDDGFKAGSVVNGEGQQYKLGEKSLWLWKGFRMKKKLNDMIPLFSEKFGISADDATNEVNAIVEQLEKIKLVN